MFTKHQIIKVVVAFALLFAVTASSGIVDDALGWSLTPAAHACQNGSTGGGGC